MAGRALLVKWWLVPLGLVGVLLLVLLVRGSSLTDAVAKEIEGQFVIWVWRLYGSPASSAAFTSQLTM